MTSGSATGMTAFVLASGITVVPPLCPADVSPYDFTRAGELIDRAAQSTRQRLEGGGLDRRDIPHQMRVHSYGRSQR